MRPRSTWVAPLVAFSLLSSICGFHVWSEAAFFANQEREGTKLVAQRVARFLAATGRVPTDLAELAPPLCDAGCVPEHVLTDPFGHDYRLVTLDGGLFVSSPGSDGVVDDDDFAVRVDLGLIRSRGQVV